MDGLFIPEFSKSFNQNIISNNVRDLLTLSDIES